jgi:hypothetical protein
MTREEYLKLKYCSNGGLCSILRAGVLVVAGIVLVGMIHNLSILVWSFYRLVSSW